MQTDNDLFFALADANRRAMIDLLIDQEHPVGAIAEQFEMSFQGVSQHLQILADAGLVTRRKRGRYRLYRASPEALREIYEWSLKYREFWQGRLQQLHHLLDDEV